MKNGIDTSKFKVVDATTGHQGKVIVLIKEGKKFRVGVPNQKQVSKKLTKAQATKLFAVTACESTRVAASFDLTPEQVDGHYKQIKSRFEGWDKAVKARQGKEGLAETLEYFQNVYTPPAEESTGLEDLGEEE